MPRTHERRRRAALAAEIDVSSSGGYFRNGRSPSNFKLFLESSATVVCDLRRDALRLRTPTKVQA